LKKGEKGGKMAQKQVPKVLAKAVLNSQRKIVAGPWDKGHWANRK